jgi:hypothetical protein
MLAVDDLIKSVTETDALELCLDILETLGVPARSWRIAGARRVILRSIARAFAGVTVLDVEAIRAGWLDTAEGPWLTRLAYYVYGVTRIPETTATGQLQLANSGGGVYHFDPDEVRALDSTTGKAYRNTAAFDLNPGDTVLVDFSAVELGSDSSAGPGEIDSLETTIIGVSVTNPAAFIGQDAEEDEPLRARCLDRLASLSPLGPRGAYRYAVLSALRDDGTPVDINRAQVQADPATGIVTIYAASPTGTPTSADLDFARADIEAIARPDSVTANLFGATPVGLGATLTIWATRSPGVSAANLRTLVLAALEKAIKNYPIGGIAKTPSTQGYLYGDYVAGIVESAHPTIFDVDGADTDLPLSPGEVATLVVDVSDVRIVEAGT